jgi:hypothetical protein
MNQSNAIGKRGESIFEVLLTKYIAQKKRRLFDIAFLGDKFPTVDFYVELLNGGATKAFFFASVKSTRQPSLNISVPFRELKELSRYDVPTYIFGIDEKRENGYLLFANPLSLLRRAVRIPMRHRIDDAALIKLYDEVNGFWRNSHHIQKFTSKFKP